MTSPAPSQQRLEGDRAYAAQALAAIGEAQHELRWLSNSLDGRWYGGADLADAVKQFVLRSERANVHILLNQPRRALMQAPQLIEVARRLTSRIEFRVLAEDDLGETGECLVADRSLTLRRLSPGTLDAQLYLHDPAQAHRSREHFERLWERALPADELRALAL